MSVLLGCCLRDDDDDDPQQTTLSCLAVSMGLNEEKYKNTLIIMLNATILQQQTRVTATSLVKLAKNF